MSYFIILKKNKKKTKQNKKKKKQIMKYNWILKMISLHFQEMTLLTKLQMSKFT